MFLGEGSSEDVALPGRGEGVPAFNGELAGVIEELIQQEASDEVVI